MRKGVEIVARSIQVTASSESSALEYFREDAVQFRRDLNYDLEDVYDTDDEITEDFGDVSLDVSIDSPRGRGERLWTGDVSFTCVVEADTDEDAYVAARALMTA